MSFAVSVLLVASLLAGCGRNAYKVAGNKVTVSVARPEPGGARKVRFQVLGDKIIRISATPDRKFHDRKSLVVLPQEPSGDFTVAETAEGIRLETGSCAVVVRPDGSIWHYDAEGTLLQGDGRFTFDPIEVEGKKALSVGLQ